MATDKDPSVTIEPFDRVGVFVAIAGAVDVVSADILHDAIASAIRAGYQQLVVDFSETTFFDSGAFRVLVEAVEPLRDDDDASVILVGADGSVARVLEVVEAGLLFSHYRDRSMARRALQLTAPRTAWR